LVNGNKGLAACPGRISSRRGTGWGWSGTFFGGVDNIGYDFGARSDSFNFEVAPVPEPATWAMLISGFALAGAAMRRRSQQTVPSHA